MQGIRGGSNRFTVFLLGVLLFSGPAFAQKKPKVIKAPAQPAASEQTPAEPDKVLYERGLLDIKHGRYTEGRLALQTLINTYPDSEFLAKAKLATGDSYYKEGGNSNLTEAISEYQDFTTFFPFLEEAAYAQMQIAMCHYRMMEKADRDDEQALDAEDAYQSFILKYPQSPLIPQAEQRLRDVQEVLAQGEYEIAHYYYTKPDYRAAAARLVELTQRYPLFSQSDEALFMLGDIYQKARLSVKNEDEKNHWADLAAKCYDRIVTDYPLSKRSADAKHRLQELGMPVPAADPGAYERMAREQKLEQAQQHEASLFGHQASFLKMPLELFNTKPNVSDAAHVGAPNLNPPNDAISATDVLRPDAPGPDFNLANRSIATADSPAGADGGQQVDVTPGASVGSASTSVGAEIISTGPNSQPSPSVDANGVANPSSVGGGSDVQTIVPQAVTGNDAGPAPTPATSSAGTTQATQGSSSIGPVPAPAPAPAPAPTAGSTQTSNGSAAATSSQSSDSQNESSSKKKKGLHKLIPW